MFTFDFLCQTGWKTTLWKWPLLNRICTIQLGECHMHINQYTKKNLEHFFPRTLLFCYIFWPRQNFIIRTKEKELKIYSISDFIMTLSQLNDRNAVQKWSFSKCGFSTCLASKIKGKHVYGNIIVLFLQKIARGASWRPPGGPRVAPQNVRFKICPVFY